MMFKQLALAISLTALAAGAVACKDRDRTIEPSTSTNTNTMAPGTRDTTLDTTGRTEIDTDTTGDLDTTRTADPDKTAYLIDEDDDATETGDKAAAKADAGMAPDGGGKAGKTGMFESDDSLKYGSDTSRSSDELGGAIGSTEPGASAGASIDKDIDSDLAESDISRTSRGTMAADSKEPGYKSDKIDMPKDAIGTTTLESKSQPGYKANAFLIGGAEGKTKIRIDTNNFKPGTYLVRINNDGDCSDATTSYTQKPGEKRTHADDLGTFTVKSDGKAMFEKELDSTMASTWDSPKGATILIHEKAAMDPQKGERALVSCGTLTKSGSMKAKK